MFLILKINYNDTKNRKAELLLLFIQSRGKFLSYLEIAMELGNNNTHRYRSWLEKEGVKFNQIKIKTKNRFNNEIEYKKFQLGTKIGNAKIIFRKINK